MNPGFRSSLLPSTVTLIRSRRPPDRRERLDVHDGLGRKLGHGDQSLAARERRHLPDDVFGRDKAHRSLRDQPAR